MSSTERIGDGTERPLAVQRAEFAAIVALYLVVIAVQERRWRARQVH